ncbi:MAG: hypothetical protein SGPRY_008492, partial [Prymnesium sp.]
YHLAPAPARDVPLHASAFQGEVPADALPARQLAAAALLMVQWYIKRKMLKDDSARNNVAAKIRSFSEPSRRVLKI